MLLCCAAISASNDPYAYLLVPQIGYMQTALPVVVATVAVAAPVLVAREAASRGGSAVAAAALVESVLLVVAAIMVAWLGQRLAGRAAVKP